MRIRSIVQSTTIIQSSSQVIIDRLSCPGWLGVVNSLLVPVPQDPHVKEIRELRAEIQRLKSVISTGSVVSLCLNRVCQLRLFVFQPTVTSE